ESPVPRLSKTISREKEARRRRKAASSGSSQEGAAWVEHPDNSTRATGRAAAPLLGDVDVAAPRVAGLRRHGVSLGEAPGAVNFEGLGARYRAASSSCSSEAALTSCSSGACSSGVSSPSRAASRFSCLRWIFRARFSATARSRFRLLIVCCRLLLPIDPS